MATAFFYPNAYPQVGDIIVAQVTEIKDGSVYCQLLEYTNCNGMIPGNELSQRRVTNIRSVVTVGATEYLQVIAVDTAKGYIDLSKKSVTADEIRIAKDNYDTTRKLHAFFNKWSTADTHLVETIMWPEYDPGSDAAEHSYASLTVDFINDSDLPAHIKTAFTETFKPVIKHTQTFELICYEDPAVDKINAALDAGREMSTTEYPLTIIYTGKSGRVGTEYQVSTRSNDPQAAVYLTQVVEKIKNELKD